MEPFFGNKTGLSDSVSIIRIPSHTIAHKILYFENNNNKILYNWVEIKNEVQNTDKVSATVALTDVNNQLLQEFFVVDNKILNPTSGLIKTYASNIKKNSDDDPLITGAGGDATVTGYIKNHSNGLVFWYIEYLIYGSSHHGLYDAPDDNSSGGSISFSLDNPTPEDLVPDSVQVKPDGTTRFICDFYWFVIGRHIKVIFSINSTTKELVGGVDVSILGVGVYGINYKGVKSSYFLGTPDNLYIDLSVKYVIPIISLVGDVTIPVK